MKKTFTFIFTLILFDYSIRVPPIQDDLNTSKACKNHILTVLWFMKKYKNVKWIARINWYNPSLGIVSEAGGQRSIEHNFHSTVSKETQKLECQLQKVVRFEREKLTFRETKHYCCL